MKKSEVILMPTNGIIKGFATLKIMHIEIEGNGKLKKVPGIFSGDTIISPEYWGMKIINGVFANLLLREKLKRPFGELYWFLISKGYKTYLALTNNFTDYGSYKLVAICLADGKDRKSWAFVASKA